VDDLKILCGVCLDNEISTTDEYQLHCFEVNLL
jgi:hypothetical protein